MKALGLVLSDKKIFFKLHFENLCLAPGDRLMQPTRTIGTTCRGPPRDHSCDVWSKSNELFQRRRCLSKKVYARRTMHDSRRTTTDDGQRPVTIAHPKHFVLR